MPDEVKEVPAKEVTPPEGAESEEVITDEHIAKEKDPAKQEHLKARQKKQQEGPPEGSPRWNEIYKKAKDGERKTAELEKKIQDMENEHKKTFSELMNHNKRLMESIKETVPVKRNETPQQVLDKLREEKKKARADYDYDKALEIQDQIDDLIILVSQSKTEETKAVAKQTLIEEEVTSAVSEFSNKNKWFLEKLPNGKDNPDYDYVKSGAATALERKLLPTWSGSYRSLLREVEKQIESKFSGTPVKVPAVGGDGTEHPVATDRVELTAEQRDVARKMFEGDPDAEKRYAEQLKLIMKGGKR